MERSLPRGNDFSFLADLPFGAPSVREEDPSPAVQKCIFVLPIL